ncbi:hypothetical protein GCM10009783_18980 [Glycomyces lechevalierae]
MRLLRKARAKQPSGQQKTRTTTGDLGSYPYISEPSKAACSSKKGGSGLEGPSRCPTRWRGTPESARPGSIPKLPAKINFSPGVLLMGDLGGTPDRVLSGPYRVCADLYRSAQTSLCLW